VGKQKGSAQSWEKLNTFRHVWQGQPERELDSGNHVAFGRLGKTHAFSEPLSPGEYAVVELLDKKQIKPVCVGLWRESSGPPQNAGAWMPRQPDKGNYVSNSGFWRRGQSRSFF